MHTSISRHAEYFFIVANLLTGLLNYARSPLLYTPNREFAALIAYMFVLCLGAQIYDRYFSSRRSVLRANDAQLSDRLNCRLVKAR